MADSSASDSPPPAKKGRTDYGSAHHLDPLPAFNVEEMYNPVNVTITVRDGAEDEEFQEIVSESFTVAHTLICAHSDYFKGAFLGHFSESEKKALSLDDVSPEIFKVFMHWMFVHDVTIDGEDATSWPIAFLVRLWVFADKYGCKGFRQRIVEKVQIMLYQNEWHILLSAEDVRYVYEHTVPSSNFRRLLLEYFVWDDMERVPKEAKDLAEYPSEFLAELFVRQRHYAAARCCVQCIESADINKDDVSDCHNHNQSDGFSGPERRWCEFHEHDTDEEAWMCMWRFHAVKHRFFGHYWPHETMPCRS